MSERKPTLNYQPPPPETGHTFVGQCAVACVGTAVLVPVATLLSIAATATLVNRFTDDNTIIVGAAYSVAALVVVGFIGSAAFLMRRRRTRGFGVGIVLGFGFDALLAGFCFGVLR